MYAQSRLVTSVRGYGPAPMTAASAGEIFIGFMNAADGLRLEAVFFFFGAFFLAAFLTVFFLADFLTAFLAAFFAGFFAAFFFLVAIASLHLRG